MMENFVKEQVAALVGVDRIVADRLTFTYDASNTENFHGNYVTMDNLEVGVRFLNGKVITIQLNDGDRRELERILNETVEPDILGMGRYEVLIALESID